MFAKIKNKYLPILLTALMTGWFSHGVLAMESDNFQINKDIFGSSGISGSSSTNYELTDSFGEPLAGGQDESVNFDLESSGFIQSDNEVLLDSGATSQSYLNSNNQTAFNIQCVGVTDNEVNQTITCEASFDQNNWYTVGSIASPITDETIGGTPNVSSWTGWPADGVITFYVRAQDGYYESVTKSFNVNKDVTAPNTSAAVTNGTAGANGWYVSDAEVTITPADNFSGVNNTKYCVDQTDTCSPTTDYTSVLTISDEGTNFVRYFSIDNADNTQIAEALEVDIDKSAPTAAPSCSPTSGTYFKDNLDVTCVSGSGGTNIRFTDDGSEPDQSSAAWTDHEINISSNFKFITCDDANNCYLTSSNYTYDQDNTPPPVPVMNPEPTLTAENDNTASAGAVVDTQSGNVTYQFCINETDSTTGCSPSAWLTEPAYNFDGLQIDHIYYYFVRARDGLENTSDWSDSVYSTQVEASFNYYYYLENDSSVNAIVNNNLIGWWDYEETDGTTGYDRSGNGNDGTYHGTTSVAGQLLRARSFNGTTDYLNIGKNISVKGQSQRTISSWIKVGSLSNYATIYYETTGNTSTWARLNLTVETDGSVRLGGRDTDDSQPIITTFAQTNTGEIATDTWYHIMAVFNADNDEHRIFVNGVDKTIITNPANTFPSTDPVEDIWLGADNTVYQTTILDETKIFDRALTSTDANNEYLKRITTDPYIDDHNYTQGIRYFHVRPRTIAYNWGAEQYFETDYDSTPPNIDSITSVAEDATAPYFDTSDDGNTPVVFVSSDNLTGVSGCKWSESDQSYNAMPNTCTDANNCNLNLTGEGEKTVYFRCIDGVDNESSSSFVLNYTIDTTPPAVTSIISVAGDNTIPYKDNTDNSGTALVYTTTADAIACRWSETDQSYAAMTDTCSDTTNCNLDLTGDGDKTVFMRCIDIAGLSSASSYILNYTIDTTPPIINSITSVAGDTASVYYDNTDDGSTEIIFDVSADATECKWSAADQSYDSMPNTCSTPGNCTANLAGQGAKTVYLRCKDDVDNKMTTSTQVDYVIDSIAPGVLSITSVANDFIAPYLDTTIPYGQAPVVYVASADATACRWSVNNVEYDSMTNTCTSTSNCTITHSGDGGKSIFFRCTDEAGNKSPNSYQLDFEVDENIDGGGIRAEETSSQPNDPTNFFITFTPKLVAPAAVNGSIRIRLESEYDLSALTHDDVFAAGGDVIWTDDELIYPDNNIIVFPFTGDLSNDDGQLSLTIANLQTINPGSTGSFFVSYDIFDNPAGTGTSLESGDGLVHLNYIVIVTASVPSFLEATINPVGVGENINGNITNIATNKGQVVDFGTFTGADDRIAAHDIAISTNANSGYQVSIEYDHSLAAGTNFVPDFVGTNANPLSWQTPPGSGIEAYFGYTTNDDSLWSAPTNRFAGGKWSGFTTEPQEVIYENHTVDNQTTRIGYRLQISGQQGVGFYNSNISYIITSTY